MQEVAVSAASIRKLFQTHGVNGKELSNIQISNLLGLTLGKDKDKMRSRLNDLTRHGEIKRVRPGVYVYNFMHNPREAPKLTAVWRFVRKHKSGWTLNECALMTSSEYTHVYKYIKWLETQGFIEVIGKNQRQAALYKATKKADVTPETPLMNKKLTDPFEKEKVALAQIISLFQTENLYLPRVGKEICEALEILQKRFNKQNQV